MSKEQCQPRIKKIENTWLESTLLAQSGFFYLTEVVELLNVRSSAIKSKAHQLGSDAFKEIGVMALPGEQSPGRWVILMDRFGPYYQKELIKQIQQVKPHWDGNDLLRRKGIFYLSDVCRLLPLDPVRVRYQIRKMRTHIGIWKDKATQTYLVDMSVFGPWLIEQWRKEP